MQHGNPSRAALYIFLLAALFTLPTKLKAIPTVLISAVIDARKGTSVAMQFMSFDTATRERRLSRLSDTEKSMLRYSWEFWRRPNQELPSGNEWQTWLIKAGRGFGKTRTGAETVRIWIKTNKLVNIIAPTADDVRKVCIEGESGIMAICSNADRPIYKRSSGCGELDWPNGAKTLLFSADEPDRLRGKQHMRLWCDELAAWRYLADAWDQAMLGLRLGANPQAIVTTTPKPLKAIKELIDSPTTFLTNGTTYDNRENLAKQFYERVIKKYEGTRLGRQELNAEMLEDRPGALWTLRVIDETRISPEKFWQEIFPMLSRVVGAIDAATTSTEDSDETGIVFAGMDKQEPPHFYVFEDRSGTYKPDEWARAAINGYHHFKADCIVGETNNGGEMIEATLRHTDVNVSYRGVHASRGKITRAEPVSAVYEQKRVHHIGTFGAMEDQMCDYDPLITTDSPDRMDALVWAITELMDGYSCYGLLEHDMHGRGEEQMNALEKVKSAKSLIKPVVPDEVLRCPSCGSTALNSLSGNEKICAQCSTQFFAGGTSNLPQAEVQSRKDYLAKLMR